MAFARMRVAWFASPATSASKPVSASEESLLPLSEAASRLRAALDPATAESVVAAVETALVRGTPCRVATVRGGAVVLFGEIATP